MDDCLSQAGDLMDKAVVDGFGDVMSVRKRETPVDSDPEFGAKFVPDPADSDILHRFHAGDLGRDGLHLRNHGRINCVHETAIDLASRILEDEQDRDGDDEADDGIRDLPAGDDTKSSKHHSKRRQTVGASV